jgi:hypothetical protein
MTELANGNYNIAATPDTVNQPIFFAEDVSVLDAEDVCKSLDKKCFVYNILASHQHYDYYGDYAVHEKWYEDISEQIVDEFFGESL